MTRKILFALLMALSMHAGADRLLVERTQAGVGLPHRGSSMSAVEAQFGAPGQKFDAVGKPPISRWVYPAFTVYFEKDRVIHAVINKAAASEIGPKPAR
jgi:hypothetical protein